jgi:hypothetical protein
MAGTQELERCVLAIVREAQVGWISARLSRFDQKRLACNLGKHKSQTTRIIE